jgi:hypothetical protein
MSEAEARRGYGTGSLRRSSALVDRLMVWARRAEDDAQGRPARTPGERDGLTKTQAEERFRKMRGALAPPRDARPQEVPPLTVASDLRIHLSPFFGERTLDRSPPRTSSATSRPSARRSRSRRSATTSTRCTRCSSSGSATAGAQRNPVKLAERPVIKKTETRIQFLDQGELEKLLAAPYPDDAFGHRSSRRST